MQQIRVYSIFLLLFVSISSEIFAQNTEVMGNNGLVSGVITDSLSGSPIESANFLLYRLKDSTLAYGTVSGKDGKFILKDIVYSEYFAKVSCVGYRTRKRNKIIISNDNYRVNLGNIQLLQKSISTSEVKITAEKERIVYSDDKITVNVDRNAGANAEEILENTPMVNLDIEGTISLMGRPGAQIYVNGKPGKYSGINDADDLKLLHISEIEKIELLPDPSAEYGNSSQAGIINIITKKTVSDKYTASANIRSNTLKDIISFTSISYSRDNISVNGRYTNEYSGTDRESISQKKVTLADKQSYLERVSTNSAEFNSNYVALVLNIRDEKNALLAQTNYRNIFNHIKSSSLMDYTDDNKFASSKSQSRNLTGNYHQFFNATANYDRLFSTKGKSLNLFLAFASNAMHTGDDIYKESDLLYPNISSYSVQQQNTSSNANRNFTGMVAYNAAISEAAIFRINVSSVYTKLSLLNNYTRFDPSYDEYMEDFDSKMVQTNKNLRNVVSGSLSGVLWNTNYRLSLSADNLYQESEEQVHHNKFSRNFLKLIPHISLSRNFLGKHSISISYRRSFDYPKNRELNPHIEYSDSTNIEMGNPKLEPYSIDRYSIRYTIPYGEEFLNINGFYDVKKNGIESITTQITPGTAMTTYKNIASSFNYGVGISASKKLFKWLTLQPEMSLSGNKYDSPYSSNEYIGGRGSLRLSLSLEYIKFQFNQNYSTKSLNAQDKTKAMYYATAMMKVLLLSKKVTISLKATDLFNTRNSDIEKTGAGFYSFDKTRQTTRIFSLELSYYFQLKADDNLDERSDNGYEDDF